MTPVLQGMIILPLIQLLMVLYPGGGFTPAAPDSNGQLKLPVTEDSVICKDTSFTISFDNLTYTIGLQFTEINYNRITVEVRDKDSLISSSDWPFSYPVFRIFVADADNNGTPDIGLGTIKKTRFDPVMKKRPFFFKIKNGFIRPLWLGTTLGWDLIDFKPKKKGDKTYITAMMKSRSKYIIADYYWKGFGFRMDTLTGTFNDYSTAYHKFTGH